MKQLLQVLLLNILIVNISQATIEIGSTVNPSADNTCDGAIYLNVSGTAKPFTFQWSHGATTQNALNLCSGIYQVTITNAYECETVLEAYVATPLQINSWQILTGSGGCGPGSAAVHVTGGRYMDIKKTVSIGKIL